MGARPLKPWEQAHHDRLVAAAHVALAELSDNGRSVLRWLAGWDEPTIAGLVELLHAARDADRAYGGAR